MNTMRPETQEKIDAIKLRITGANPTQLVVIVYELILLYMDEADYAFSVGNKEGGVTYIKKAQDFLQEQMGSLDLSYDIGVQLMNLYRFVNEQFIATTVKQEPVNLDSCRDTISKLMESFDTISKQDESGAVMENTQEVYQGLTYGKNSMGSTYVKENDSRGFKA